VKDAQGQTPLTIALVYLRERGGLHPAFPVYPRAGPARRRTRARLSGAAESIFLALVHHGATLKGATAAITAPLMEAVQTGDRDAVIQLLDLEADVNFRSNDGYTPSTSRPLWRDQHGGAVDRERRQRQRQDDFGNTLCITPCSITAATLCQRCSIMAPKPTL